MNAHFFNRTMEAKGGHYRNKDFSYRGKGRSFPSAVMLVPVLLVCIGLILTAKAQDAYEPDNTAADAKTIANGQRQNRSIHQAGNVDWVKFTIGANGATNVRIETDGASGDTEMWLYGPNSSTTQKDYDDDDGNGDFSLITQASLAAGTYYIKITEYGNNGTIAAYTLRASWTEGGGGWPDLTKESDNISQTSGAPGDTFTITHRVRNAGTASSGATKIYYYVNKGSWSTAAAAKVGERNLEALAAGAVSGQISFPWTAPANLPAGNYFIGYWIDGPQSVAESNENNNIWYWSNVPIVVWNGEAVNWRVDYGNNWNKSGTITKPGATRVRVRFSQIRTESGADHLRSETGNDWSGSFNNVTSGAKAGNTIQLTLTSDESVTGHFIIDRVEWLGTSTVPASKAGDLFGPVTFSAGGTVSGATQSGVTITFTRVSGSGAIPAAVATSNNGAWSQSGFVPGTTYRARPSKAGYTFNPASRDFGGASSTLNFVSTVSVGVAFREAGDIYGYDDYTVPSHPWKSVAVAGNDNVLAVVDPASAYNLVSFLSLSPTRITISPATPSSANQIVTLNGVARGTATIWARAGGLDINYFSGASYPVRRRTVAVTLVHELDKDGPGPDRGYRSTDISDADIIAGLRRAYKQAVMQWTVVRQPAKTLQFDLNNDGYIDVRSWMSAEMRVIRDACSSAHEFNIFLVDRPNDGSLGFMQLNQKYGFVHAGGGNGPNSVAHELGHGQGLPHCASGDTQNLMHATSSNPWRLRKGQWDSLNP